jgi:shikimate dehydrogenase
MQFGLIGESLNHSFSKSYFEQKFKTLGLYNYSYTNFELKGIDELLPLLESNNSLKGFNVTIPYKEKIIPFLHAISPEAKEIGAVNCVHIVDNKTMGYNTDVYGFSQSVKPFLDVHHERALILGTGGASKAVAFALKKVGTEVWFASTSAKKNQNTFHYSEINEMVITAFKCIVNSTPLGTFPNAEECPKIPYEFITRHHLVYDLVYNPPESLFLKKCKQKGAIVLNGLSMLQLQAEKSWEIWQGQSS